MYESFYNFKAEPFRLSPDHRFCFSHKSYAKAKAYMQYAIHRAEGFVMVTGKPGTGKTTLVNDLVEGLSDSQIVVATIVSTQLEADDLLRLVACNFGLDIDAPNKAIVLQGLSVRLRRHHEEGTRALLIIDEAQDLSASALEELRLLTNLQLNNQPLLQIFLIGQENLRDLVQRPSMEQVHQRLVAACHLESLNEEDTKAYIKHRLDRVGWKDDPSLDEGVFSVAYQFSKGIPRRINLVCSRFLLHGSVEEKHRIRASDVRTVVQELQNEQLTPIGFKAELPPLDEEDDHEEPQAKPETRQQEQTATETTKDNADTVVERIAPVADEPSSLLTEPMAEPASLKALNNSLEALIQESNEDALKKGFNDNNKDKTSTATDVIQEDYFSLGEAIDSISEPIPISDAGKKNNGGQYGYGDRFANAQRKSKQTNTATHYYNEYQTEVGGHVTTHKKRGFFSSMLLFLLILAILFVGIYIIRPQILQSEIAYAEGKFSHYLKRLKDTYSTSGQAPAILDERIIEEKEKALNAVHSKIKESPTVSEPVVTELESPALDELSAAADSDQANQQIAVNGLTQEIDSIAPKKALQEDQQTKVGLDKKENNQTTEGLEVLTEQSHAIAVPVELPVVEERKSNDLTDSNETKDVPVQSISEVSTFSDEHKVFAVSSAVLDDVNVDQSSFKGEENSLFKRLTEKRASETQKEQVERARTQVLFKSDSTSVDSKYYPELDDVVQQLTKSAKMSARITGYADKSGDPYYNQKLSIMRANAVAAYLEKHDVASARLVVEGRGVYVLPGDSIENAAINKQSQRMVEIVLVTSESDR
ncbi:MAG: AAA family ATPase [Sedimenticola sp.]|nr:AAA family ATPase [Sedimenticola sp.]